MRDRTDVLEADTLMPNQSEAMHVQLFMALLGEVRFASGYCRYPQSANKAAMMAAAAHRITQNTTLVREVR